MILDVVITSKETIKPSSATPSHLKTFKLSLLDQYSPPISVPVILFYPATGEKDGCKLLLKKSFSEALGYYYPLAGTVEDNNSIDCNDEGVEYLEAEVKCRLAQILGRPGNEELNQLLPLKPWSGMSSDMQLQIQVSTFTCGGISIAARISHKVADGATLCSFINTWAKKARGEHKVVRPLFELASLFPPREVSAFKPPKKGLDQKLVTRRFVFRSSKLQDLKAICASRLYVENPTRVEVVSALIWKCLMNVATSKPGCPKPFGANIAVNLRNRMVPPVPESLFGNFIIGALPMSQSGVELHSLVRKLRGSVSKIDHNYVDHLRYDDGVSLFHDCLKESFGLVGKGELGFYTITSWCRFPFYEADFGWGEPIWVTPLNMDHKNVVMLVDTKYGDGIEAFVTLDEEDMTLLESEKELFRFTEAA
ncbi:shikimate O-hydroxycinnamoyltransferase [Ranunculus cassubicifolius]